MCVYIYIYIYTERERERGALASDLIQCALYCTLVYIIGEIGQIGQRKKNVTLFEDSWSVPPHIVQINQFTTLGLIYFISLGHRLFICEVFEFISVY